MIPSQSCAPKFLQALENDQFLVAHPPTGDGGPSYIFQRGVKNCLKMY